MAELDFAFLADYATVEQGKLTVVGGCYTHAWPSHELGQPIPYTTFLAGRVRVTDRTKVTLGVRLTSPGPTYEIETHTALEAQGDPYDDSHRSIVFAARLDVPIVGLGLYEVHLSLDDQPARRLAFTVEPPPGRVPESPVSGH